MCCGGMEILMQAVFSILAAVTGIYSIIILIRIVLSWFSMPAAEKPVEFINKITDPYLDFWRRFTSIRIGNLDFSVVIAVAVLSFLQSVFRMLSVTGTITFGNLLSIIIISLWSIVSFIAGFLLIILILRMIAYLTSRDIYSPFWSTIDSISKPVLYRFNRIFYGNKTGNYLKGMILSCLILLAVIIGGRIIIILLVNLLSGLPV